MGEALLYKLCQGPVLEVFEIDPSFEVVAGLVSIQRVFAVAEINESDQMSGADFLGNKIHISAMGVV